MVLDGCACAGVRPDRGHVQHKDGGHELCARAVQEPGKNNLSSFMQFVVQVMTEYQVWFTWPMRCERPWMHRVSTSLSRSRVF